MFTPAITTHGPRVTVSPYALPSLSSVAQTTLIQELRRDPPGLLTNDRTCGYTSGVWSSAVTCGPGHSCTYYTTPYSAPNFGCCTNGAECGYVSTCVDYKAAGNPNTIGGFLLMDKGMYCGSAFPYCSTVLLYGTTYATGSSYSFYSYGCLTSKLPDVTALQTTLDDRAEATTSTSASSSAASTTIASTASSSNASASPSNSSESSQMSSANPSTLSSSDAMSSSSPLSSSVTTSSSSSPSLSSPSSSPSSSTSSTGLSQTSQIGIAVGASIGFSVLLAALAFIFWRHRKNKVDKRWVNQPPQSFNEPYPENKSLYPFDHRFSSLRSNSSGNSEAPFELASTDRRHELAGSGRHELGSEGGRVEAASVGRRHELATSGY